ncbi:MULTISPECIES: metal-dependent hydrolase [Desulfococcus]|uniref:Membrane-bound metal-dependent hydrolase n=1 Tax=Desulfococcus multivorans DSM 2059 TaxID=1121405 RepID=S7TPR0_DESML|nr:metal-dependent hydrolase [Desulfococcus multivorans]AOY60281.1 conserved uncharacterized protein [Desulfococcus multivorans]AQV02392.1 metal-dependent hydrolase [Desulfococcus multivorans]EPR39207.1 Protein of unknown function DUF457, transmembrane [Desulfococcus multivorans DSM 2059]MDX9819700.1 metal-dependent hydrolase [Desulfococcus multivorans]SJZ57835.1 LexA-binding, inner membrane-associated putative hydrolase [Desulfococcus multivorans DSM 2059]
MADFKTHITAACAVSGLAATCLLAGGAARPEQVLLYFVLGSVGGVLPDIDADNSVPLKLTFDILSFVVAFVVMFSQPWGDSVIELALIWVAVFLAVKYLVFSFFIRMTVHRGVIHSIPAGVTFGLTVVILLDQVRGISAGYAWMGGFFLFMGYLVHLFLDELYSIDFSGMRMRGSFGTALKFISFRDMTATLVLYAAMILLFFTAPSPGRFLRLILDKSTYAGIRFLP